MLDSGINIGTDEFEYFDAVMYTRVREDRKNRKGSTPTKFKVPISQFDCLPHIHPATDIPYSYALSIAPSFIGRKVLVEHDDLKQAGHIVWSGHTENPAHTLPESNKEECTHEGKSLKFSSIIGILAVDKKKKKKYLENFHIKGIKDLDCSIGYGYHFDYDDEDMKFQKNGDLDWNKTLVYATGFQEREVSLCDHGSGACPGANVISQLSNKSKSNIKFGMSAKLWKIFSKRSKKLCKNILLKGNILKLPKCFKTFKLNTKKILFGKNFLQKNKRIILKNINIILKKKKMSEDKVKEDAMEVDTAIVEDTKKKPEEEDFTIYLRELGIPYNKEKEQFKEIGKLYVKEKAEFNKLYKESALKNFDEEKTKFKKVVKTLKKEDMLDESLENDLKEMYSDPDKEPLSRIFKSLIDKFTKISDENRLHKEKKTEPIKLHKDLKDNKSTYYSKLLKTEKEKKLCKKPIEQQLNVKESTNQDKTAYWNLFKKFNPKKGNIL